ncbi:MAG: hypothetical protein Ct9H300mP8_13280 [Gammaproteobacteria bacterium]|nr:MAG: hypothetical protein Ct9H300mP8_13280 [Gammaproteobacteria bacterium]
MLPPVGRFFIEEGLRENEALAAKLGKLTQPEKTWASFMRETKKGPAVASQCMSPSITWVRTVSFYCGVARRIGTRARFLWTWVREARSRGAILISPTARGTHGR